MICAITAPSQWEPPWCSRSSLQLPEQESTQPILSPAPLQQRLAGFDSLDVLPEPGHDKSLQMHSNDSSQDSWSLLCVVKKEVLHSTTAG